MRRSSALLIALTAALLAVAAVVAYTASAMSPGMTQANLTILHSYRGCHVMTLNGDNADVRTHIYIRAGHALTIRNLDSCEHQLVQTAGPKDVQMISRGAVSDGHLAALGKPVLVRMHTPGAYEFTTVEGDHPDPELATTAAGFFKPPSYGPDNTLKIRVTVLPPRTDSTD